MVDFNLNGFMKTYGEYARAYLFKCSIHHLRNRYGVNDHEYLVKSTKLPEGTIDELKADWQGMEYKIGATSLFQDFNVMFNMDANGKIRMAFLDWMNDIHDPSTNTHGNPRDYFSDITLNHLDGRHRTILTYTLIDAWPKMVSEVTLDYAAKEIATFDVTFAYQYHITRNSGGNIGSLAQRFFVPNEESRIT